MNPSEKTTSSADRLLARVLATLIALVFTGLGVMAIVTGHYDGRSSRWGSEVALDGEPALLMGLALAAMGLFPLGIWFRTRRQALIWVLLCFAVSAAAFLVRFI